MCVSAGNPTVAVFLLLGLKQLLVIAHPGNTHVMTSRGLSVEDFVLCVAWCFHLSCGDTCNVYMIGTWCNTCIIDDGVCACVMCIFPNGNDKGRVYINQ